MPRTPIGSDSRFTFCGIVLLVALWATAVHSGDTPLTKKVELRHREGMHCLDGLIVLHTYTIADRVNLTRLVIRCPKSRGENS